MKAKVLELLQSAIDSSTGDNDNLKRFVESCLEHGAFYSGDNSEAVVKSINTCLNSPFDKQKGLVLLLALLPQVAVDVFSNSAVSWMVQCGKCLHQKGEVAESLTLKVLTKLIQLSVKFPEVNKEAVKQIVPKFLLDHVRRKPPNQIPLELLECLRACMVEYSGPCGEYRMDILRLLLSTVEARTEVVQMAARCMPLVARVGGGGKQGVSHKTAWHRQQLALATLLHSLLNQLFELINCPQEEVTPPEGVQLTLAPVEERNVLFKTQRLATQFSSVAMFLQAMLLEEFPVAKSVEPNAILDVIAHAQRPTHSTLGVSREALAVLSVLPSNQVAALRLLESLVLCVGRNLIPHGGLVCYLCSQVVMWTRKQQYCDWPYAMDKPYSRTRLAAYCCLHSWLNIVGSATQVDTLVEKALPTILTDINTEKPTVKLKMGSKSVKGKRKQQMLVNVEDRSEKLGDSVANSRLCERALHTLALLVRAANTTLKADTLTKIISTVLSLAANLPVPYSDANCRSALYQLLLVLCLEHHPTVAPPLAPAITVFTAGLQHPAPQVKATCVSALSSLEKVIRPTAATLYFPVTPEGQKPLMSDEDSEPSETPTKKRKMDSSSDSSSIISIVEIDSNGKKIEDVSEEKNDEDMDEKIDIILEVFPTKGTPEVLEENKQGGNDMECQEVVIEDEPESKHDSNEENNGLVENKDEEILCIDESDIDIIETPANDNVIVKDEVNLIPQNAMEENDEAKEVNDEVGPVGDTVQEPDDEEVSKMLMDFNDEIQ